MIPTLSYSDVRPTIRNADVMLSASNKIHSRIIRWFTKSQFNHCGLIFRVQDRVMCYEAAAHGTRQIPLSELIKKKGNTVVLARHPAVYSHSAMLIHGAALDLMAVDYDYGNLVQSAWRIIKGKFGWKGTQPRNKPLICSEFVQAAFEGGKIFLEPDERGFISPENIAQQVEIIGQLVCNKTNRSDVEAPSGSKHDEP